MKKTLVAAILVPAVVMPAAVLPAAVSPAAVLPAAVLPTAVLPTPTAAFTLATTIEVPLRVHAGRLVVPVLAADGREFDFAVTTGAGVTVLAESVAAQLGEAPSLTLGGLPVPMEGVSIVADERFERGGETVAGMISPNMLNAFDLLLDVPGGRMLLQPPGSAVAWSGYRLSAPIRVRVFHGIILNFDLELGGREYGGSIDLGTPANIVNAAVKEDLGFDEEATAVLGLAGAMHPDTPVTFRDLAVFERWSPDGDGFVILGAPLAYDCAIAISWVHREMRTCVR